MSSEFLTVAMIALTTGIIHTLLGPDHYLPFIALAQDRSWSRQKTAWITAVCGLGHVLSSVFIGVLAIGFRFSMSALHIIDSARSDFAAWALIAFGFTYFVWGLKRLFSKEHDSATFRTAKFNPLCTALFVIFVVGPCEPLFFLMSYPSLAHNPLAITVLVGIFSVATVATMISVVLGASFGLGFLRGERFARLAPALTGSVIMFCGAGIKFLGL